MPRPARCVAPAEQPRVRSNSSEGLEQLTRPQKRRRRLQLLAVHKAANVSQKQEETNDSMVGQCVDWRTRFSSLEFAIGEIHWYLVGQWQHFQLSAQAHGQEGGFVFDPASADFIPGGMSTADDIISSRQVGEDQSKLGVITPDGHLKLEPQGPSRNSSLPSGASDHSASDAGDSDISGAGSGDYDTVCTSCGRLFVVPSGEDEYDGDRCDECAAPHHPQCLHVYHDLKGEWELCASCVTKRKEDCTSIQGDFRTFHHSHWASLHAACQRVRSPSGVCKSSSSDSATEDKALAVASKCESGTRDHNVENVFGPLEVTLDFMVKFLEGAHAKSEKISTPIRDRVLGLIRSAMAWKTKDRSKREVEQYVQHLNGVMGEIVSKL